MDGQFSYIGNTTATAFVDPAGSASSVYMVRTVQLERSGSGTYYNLSQGVFFGNGTIGNGGGGGGSTTGGTGSTAAAAPSNLSANSASTSQINLSWTDNSGNESGFVIDRKVGGSGVYSQVATTAANTTSYNNTGLAPGTQYYFRVRSMNFSGYSSFSNEANATTAQAAATTATATFLMEDTTTQGTWKGVYGDDGFNVVDNFVQYPGYAQVSTSAGHYQWNDATTEIRALQKVTDSQRIAACWTAASQFTIDVNLTDGSTHRVALYFMDWDRSGRSETVEVLDAVSGAVLSTQTVSAFEQGKYLVWSARGHVIFRVTRVTGSNAIVMGIFFKTPTDGSNTEATTGIISRGQFQLHLSGQAGDSFKVQSSNDLITWSTLSTIILTNTGYNYYDAEVSANQRKFYRAVKIP
jgi:hypothetical protein